MFLIQLFEISNQSLRLSRSEHRNLGFQKLDKIGRLVCCPARLRHLERNAMDPVDARLTSITYTFDINDTSDTWTNSPLALLKRATHQRFGFLFFRVTTYPRTCVVCFFSEVSISLLRSLSGSLLFLLVPPDTVTIPNSTTCVFSMPSKTKADWPLKVACSDTNS